MTASTPSSLNRLRRLRPMLEARARLVNAIRGFFADRDFLEVNTPVRIPAPALEDYIDAEPAGPGRWLRTSPELHLKRLLAAGYPRLFQLGPCFRRGECGPRHQPEFTMLEWYRAEANNRAILDDTVALVRACAKAVGGTGTAGFRGITADVDAPWEELTVDEAFAKYAGTTPEAAMAGGEGGFEQTLVEKIEPHLGRGRPTVLKEYPPAFGALARRCPHRPGRADRWELYVGGLELANAYSELTDAAEQRQRFLACAELRRRDGREVYPLDEEFLAALETGLPPSGGIALGVDRLLMVLTGADTIQDTLPFPEPA